MKYIQNFPKTLTNVLSFHFSLYEEKVLVLLEWMLFCSSHLLNSDLKGNLLLTKMRRKYTEIFHHHVIFETYLSLNLINFNYLWWKICLCNIQKHIKHSILRYSFQNNFSTFSTIFEALITAKCHLSNKSDYASHMSDLLKWLICLEIFKLITKYWSYFFIINQWHNLN